mmetsp:Transcript_39968/g.76448  ORF Transcript_39968/g.76448 Transcript_39968/m.76448 type:complete len:220 (-) Transcript_39968:318-977(-)
MHDEYRAGNTLGLIAIGKCVHWVPSPVREKNTCTGQERRMKHNTTKMFSLRCKFHRGSRSDRLTVEDDLAPRHLQLHCKELKHSFNIVVDVFLCGCTGGSTEPRVVIRKYVHLQLAAQRQRVISKQAQVDGVAMAEEERNSLRSKVFDVQPSHAVPHLGGELVQLHGDAQLVRHPAIRELRIKLSAGGVIQGVCWRPWWEESYFANHPVDETLHPQTRM